MYAIEPSRRHAADWAPGLLVRALDREQLEDPVAEAERRHREQEDGSSRAQGEQRPAARAPRMAADVEPVGALDGVWRGAQPPVEVVGDGGEDRARPGRRSATPTLLPTRRGTGRGFRSASAKPSCTAS
jgi:hypothetical protein